MKTPEDSKIQLDLDKVENTSQWSLQEKSDEEISTHINKIREDEARFKITKRFDVLDDEGLIKFEEEIKKAKGNLRIFMHPMHVSNREEGVVDGPFSYLNYPPTKMLLDTATNKSSPPIIILEDENGFDQLREVYEKIAGHNEYNPNIYIIPTLHNNGFIKLIGMDEPKRETDGSINEDTLRYGQIGILNLVNKFNKVGVKKMLIAGSSLKVDDEYLSHCVGTFINYFSQINKKIVEGNPDIEPIRIQVSTATSPHGRNELREKGYNDLL